MHIASRRTLVTNKAIHNGISSFEIQKFKTENEAIT